ncbi:hypothetical protein [Dactylosporangium matsuzakiense]|uniref:Fluoroquinolone transport system permease protein n=1 Tax=Dactylosporangium matsuzakiense TaxID=53360 RepID=A0A9W6KS25_9ACTN|nr:hypothetical protein [Dactylosporangium matsuzakiense]UWZ47663.1 hypothetical protein Dmats_15410 [Dactylosporangium matsuzakiense]GLL05614.1 hypothetical protein GCM10017581_073610 [Dactylosporangium matsuzakiense]
MRAGLALLSLEARLQWRQGIPLVIVGLAGLWSALTLLWPPATPYVIFVDTVTVGTLYAGALTISDRVTGVDAALAVSPAGRLARTVARLAPLTAATAAGAVVIRRDLTVLPAAALAGLLLLGVATAVAARRDGFVAFMVALPVPMIALLAVPLAVSIGLLHGPLWYAVPTTGALALLGAPVPAPTGWLAAPGLLLGYLALAAAVAVGFAARPPADGGRATRLRMPGRLTRPARVDLPVVIALSPLLLAGALRLGWAPLCGWLRETRGLDLEPFGAVLAIGAVAVHLPMSFGMTAALLVLDDLEDGALEVVRTSPLGTARYLARRLAAVTLLSAAGLAVAAPLSGLVPWSAAAALVLAVPIAPLVTVATLAVARTRVQGATADKVLALPVYAPIAAWWLTGPFAWLAAPLPAFWVVRAWAGPDGVVLLGGLACAAAWLIPLTRTALRRLAQERGS